MTTAVVIVLVALLLFAALRLWITANRLDRLHVRTEAAWFALEGALARRIVATRAVAAAGGLDSERADQLRHLADVADRADRAHRADAENDLSRALSTMPAVPEPDLAVELADASERVVLARRFYNDAVRDTRALRAVWFTRIFGLAGRAALPDYFEIAEFPHPPATVHRTAARVVVVDPDDRILLLSGTDPDVGSHWWHTPGGGVEDGEDIRSTARRELAEETGFGVTETDLLGPIWRRVARFAFMGSQYEQTELYFVTRVPVAAGAADGPGSGGAAARLDEMLGARVPVNGAAVPGSGLHERTTSAAPVLVASPPGSPFPDQADLDGAHPNGAHPNGAHPNGAHPNGAPPNGADPARVAPAGDAAAGADLGVATVEVAAVDVAAVGVAAVDVATGEAPDGPRINGSGRTEVERLTLTGHRWWSAEALQHTDDPVYPIELARRLREALDVIHGAAVPESPARID